MNYGYRNGTIPEGTIEIMIAPSTPAGTKIDEDKHVFSLETLVPEMERKYNVCGKMLGTSLEEGIGEILESMTANAKKYLRRIPRREVNVAYEDLAYDIILRRFTLDSVVIKCPDEFRNEIRKQLGVYQEAKIIGIYAKQGIISEVESDN